MRDLTNVTGTVTKAHRRKPARDGNPVWDLNLLCPDGTVRRLTTAEQCKSAYEIDSSWVGKQVRFTWDGGRTVSSVHLAVQPVHV